LNTNKFHFIIFTYVYRVSSAERAGNIYRQMYVKQL